MVTEAIQLYMQTKTACYSAVTWVLRYLTPLAIWLLVQQLVPYNKRTIQVPHYWPFIKGIYSSPKYKIVPFMMTPSNGNIFRVIGHFAGNSPVTSEFPSQRPVTQSFDVFFDLRLNKRLSKQLWGWWFETPSHSLWHHCYVFCVILQFSVVLTEVTGPVWGLPSMPCCQIQ